MTPGFAAHPRDEPAGARIEPAPRAASPASARSPGSRPVGREAVVALQRTARPARAGASVPLSIVRARGLGNRAVGHLLRQVKTQDDFETAHSRRDWPAIARLVADLDDDGALTLLRRLTGPELAATDAATTRLSAASRLLVHRRISFARHKPPEVGPSDYVTVTSPRQPEWLSGDVAGGNVEVRLNIDYRTADWSEASGGFSLTYTGAGAKRAHWLQFVSREVIVQRRGDPRREWVAGTYTSEGFRRRLSTSPDRPVWNVDSVSPVSPFYETTGTHNSNASTLAMFDSPGAPLDAIRPHLLGPHPALEVTSVARFAVYLVRDMQVLSRTDIYVQWRFTRLGGPGEKSGFAQAPARYSALAPEHRKVLLERYPNFDYLSEGPGAP
jgi:hypothetical protein